MSEMRLDKFLKVSRIIKRRTVAKEACDGGRVKVNGRVSKPGKYIGEGDELEITFGNRVLRVEVLECRSHVPAKESSELYEVLEERYIDDLR